MREGAYFFAHEKQRIGEMKTLATPLGLAGLGSRSTTERSDAQFFDRPVRFDRLRNVGIFCFAAFLAPLLSSFLDSAFVAINRFGQDSYWQVWRIRFTSNILASLTLVPFIVTWSGDGIAWLGKIRRARILEAGLLLIGLLSINTIVFY